MLVATSILAMQLAAAPAGAPVAEPAAPEVAEDWAAQPVPGRQDIGKAVREVIAEEKTREAEVPRRHEADTLRGGKYDSFAASFDEAAVPGCLRPDGLKRQPPRIGIFGFGGILGLPFILLAKARGKCN